MVSPSFAGEGAIKTFDCSSALILESAVPLFPDIIAPACPIRFPFGAVIPPIKPAVAFLIEHYLKKTEVGTGNEIQ